MKTILWGIKITLFTLAGFMFLPFAVLTGTLRQYGINMKDVMQGYLNEAEKDGVITAEEKRECEDELNR